MENKELLNENDETLVNEAETDSITSKTQNDEPHEKNVKLMSPGMMVLRRFFRSKLSIVGLVLIVGLFLFCWLGPVFYTQDPTAIDTSGKIDYTNTEIEYVDENGVRELYVEI